MRRKSPTLTEQELEIMKVVWQLGVATVRDVYETLLTRRKIAYTTVMTMMKIMEEKNTCGGGSRGAPLFTKERGPRSR